MEGRKQSSGRKRCAARDREEERNGWELNFNPKNQKALVDFKVFVHSKSPPIIESPKYIPIDLRSYV
jgi:hypothetical protein